MAAVPHIMSRPLAGSSTEHSPGAPAGGPLEAMGAPTHWCSPWCTHLVTSDLSRLNVPDQPGPPVIAGTIDQEQDELHDLCFVRIFEGPVAPDRPSLTSPASTTLARDQLSSPRPCPSFVALDHLSSTSPLPSGPGPGALAGGPREARGAPTLSAPDANATVLDIIPGVVDLHPATDTAGLIFCAIPIRD